MLHHSPAEEKLHCGVSHTDSLGQLLEHNQRVNFEALTYQYMLLLTKSKCRQEGKFCHDPKEE
jgi:hypothetical protein